MKAVYFAGERTAVRKQFEAWLASELGPFLHGFAESVSIVQGRRATDYGGNSGWEDFEMEIVHITVVYCEKCCAGQEHNHSMPLGKA